MIFGLLVLALQRAKNTGRQEPLCQLAFVLFGFFQLVKQAFVDDREGVQFAVGLTQSVGGALQKTA